MGRKRIIKAVVNRPEEEVLERLIAESIAKTTMLRINALPQRQRLVALEEIIKRVKMNDK